MIVVVVHLCVPIYTRDIPPPSLTSHIGIGHKPVVLYTTTIGTVVSAAGYNARREGGRGTMRETYYNRRIIKIYIMVNKQPNTARTILAIGIILYCYSGRYETYNTCARTIDMYTHGRRQCVYIYPCWQGVRVSGVAMCETK